MITKTLHEASTESLAVEVLRSVLVSKRKQRPPIDKRTPRTCPWRACIYVKTGLHHCMHVHAIQLGLYGRKDGSKQWLRYKGCMDLYRRLAQLSGRATADGIYDFVVNIHASYAPSC